MLFLPEITISQWVWGFATGLSLGLLVGSIAVHVATVRSLVVSEQGLMAAHLFDEAVETAKDEGYYETLEPRLQEHSEDVRDDLVESRRDESLLTALARRVVGR